MKLLKSGALDLAAIAVFAIIACLYFFAPVRDNLVLGGHDHTADVGYAREQTEYAQKHDGQRTRWTNAIFGGMPTYQMSPSYDSTSVLSQLHKLYQGYLPTVPAYVFMMLLGFYIMLRCFDFRVWMAAMGAILWAFSSYYFIIIAAGHIWKLFALSYIPPTIGGMVLCYKGRYVPGLVLTSIFAAMQIFSNHVQMSYYFLFVMGFMALAYLIEAIRNHRLVQWWKASACCLLGGLLGVCINISSLYHTWQYSKESMRGKTELTQKTKDAADQTKSGLERSYITAWSYGIGETWSLLVPNVKGGASVPLAANATAMEHAKADFEPIYQAFTQYFGEQPGTSGPVYVGAFVLMLFVMGLFIVKGPMKWCLLAATILSILLSWGKNFMPFTDLFLDYVPMYDKFRTVASILVMAEFTIPLLAMLALKKMVDEPELLRSDKGMQQLMISFSVTGGVCLLFWLLPDLFFSNYVSTQDSLAMSHYVQAGYIPEQIAQQVLVNMSEMRQAMFTADALRSFFIIAVGTLVLLVWRMGKIKSEAMVVCLTVLCLTDMWGVNKRYLNDGMFHPRRSSEQLIPRTQADDIILQDTAMEYRVVDMTVSTFNDNSAAYYHKSIGGYHAAKLRRYQELIEAHIQHEMQAAQQAAISTYGQLDQCPGDSLMPVLNMLNTKYLILGTKDGGKLPIYNPWANGNAWFVDQLQYVDNADDELAALSDLDTSHEAVADVKFRDILGEATPADSLAEITLTDYEANQLTYQVDAPQEGIVVFSEIYYPGWTCTIDGKDATLGRANYVLRAIRMPAGQHEVVLRFDPQSLHQTEAVAYAALTVLFLLIIGGIILYVMRQRKG